MAGDTEVTTTSPAHQDAEDPHSSKADSCPECVGEKASLKTGDQPDLDSAMGSCARQADSSSAGLSTGDSLSRDLPSTSAESSEGRKAEQPSTSSGQGLERGSSRESEDSSAGVSGSPLCSASGQKHVIDRVACDIERLLAKLDSSPSS